MITYSYLFTEGTKSDGIVSVKKYMLEDYYYILEELIRYVHVYKLPFLPCNYL